MNRYARPQFRDPAVLEAALQAAIAEGYLPNDQRSIEFAREHYRERALWPTRDADLQLSDRQVGGELNFDSLAEGDHVERLLISEDPDGPEYGSWAAFMRLWLTDWRDLLPGHFTWV